ncbi:MAG: transporter substrate-binding domain-containing protein [Cyanobacteria bacterium Co-bin8]|nr:transporter substrate-binding domain-containing protein [Cyanobacteria bacterium Co-bin8]
MRLALLGFGMILGVQFAAPPIAVSADLATIRARGYLVVAVKDNWRPLGFRDAAGELVGLEVDVARQLAQEILGDPEAVVLQPVPNTERLSAVLEDRVDVAIAGVSITPARMRLVNFSVPYYLDGTALITRQASVQELRHLARGRIAVLDNSSTVATVRYILPGSTLVGVTTYERALAALQAGEVDAFAGDVTVLSGWVQEYPTYRLLPSLLSTAPLAVVLPKGRQYSELRRSIDEVLNRWHTTGWLEERATYWGLP